MSYIRLKKFGHFNLQSTHIKTAPQAARGVTLQTLLLSPPQAKSAVA